MSANFIRMPRAAARTRFWVFIAVLAMAAAVMACGSDETPAPAEKPAAATPKMAAKATPPPAPDIPSNVSVAERDAEGNPIRFSGTDGSGNAFEASIGDDAKVPSAFPADIPLYPGAKPMAAMVAGGEGQMVTFKTQDAQQKIYEHYQTELKAQGWEIGDEQSFGGQLALVGTKDKRKLTVSISGTQGDSRISLIVVDTP